MKCFNKGNGGINFIKIVNSNIISFRFVCRDIYRNAKTQNSPRYPNSFLLYCLTNFT